MKGLTVIRPGLLSTVQDTGRWGSQHMGVPVAGPMDWYSHALANALVGNVAEAAALEVTLIGPDVEAEADVVVAVTGAQFELFVDNESAPVNAAFTLHRGQRLRFGRRVAGARAALAVRGGFAFDPVLGSRSTSLTACLGPFDGRALKAGDRLPVGDDRGERIAIGRALRLPQGGARVRVMPGPHDHQFTSAAREAFEHGRFTVSPDSNRMGYRLVGPALEHVGTAAMLSDGTPMGSLQVPPSGLPILLMADRQTTGGYPKIATVITADLPVAGQLAPGDWIEFEPCSRPAAVEALRRRLAALRGATG